MLAIAYATRDADHLPPPADPLEELAALLDPKVFKVNLIPYNPTGMYDGSSRAGIAAFKNVLDRARIPSTVRLTRGRDIAAACGQLAAAPRARTPA
jgi:23S rRNA (adenine2503-C2)-methyltransferase